MQVGMLFRLLKLPISAFTTGHIYGIPVTRNPIAWIPFLVLLPVCILALAIFNIVCVALSPVFVGYCWVAAWLWRRKGGAFSEEGIAFKKAYDRRAISWSSIREVVCQRDRKATFYRVICIEPEGTEYLMASTQDNEAFERAVIEHGIPLTIRDWHSPA
jgi:hypothetical protein